MPHTKAIYNSLLLFGCAPFSELKIFLYAAFTAQAKKRAYFAALAARMPCLFTSARLPPFTANDSA
ncbi:hypothetical protein CSQ88_10180 [Iodobacter sp. BJB302]|nr:hypothetical protein CSQ88_10180 [Iodobacter sp. BJB302]